MALPAIELVGAICDPPPLLQPANIKKTAALTPNAYLAEVEIPMVKSPFS